MDRTSPSDIEWKEAWTLEEYVVHLIKNKLTQSPEFKLLIRIYGRPKLEGIYKKIYKPTGG